MVELCESKGSLARLAMLLLRVGEPFHETFLVDELDAPTAFAGMEERFFSGAFSAAYSTGI